MAALPEDSPAAGDAERLASAVDSSLRLSIVRALAAAAEELSDDVSPAVVSLTVGADGVPRLRADGIAATEPANAAGGEYAADAGTGEDDAATAAPPAVGPEDEADNARITLRMPGRLKAQAEAVAERAGISTNRWLTQAIQAAVDPHPTSTTSRRRTQHVSGWMN
jgi:hypothetical protein